MKAIIVSDTHYHNECLYELQERYKDVEYFIHCGDLEDDPRDFPGWIVVRGNSDYFQGMPSSLILELEGHRMLVVHSHKCIAYRHLSLIHDALVKKCDIVCFGHTHIAEAYKEQGIYMINPGSIWFPRSNKPGSYVLLDIQKKKIKAQIIYNDGSQEWFTK
ncbi:MAG: YfcE family phosphodiesterase [Floccifex sp.]